MHGNHLKHMLIGGGAALAVLLLAGVPLATALPFAIALACPLMMIFMMRSMGGDHAGHGAGEHDRATRPDPAETVITAEPRVEGDVPTAFPR